MRITSLVLALSCSCSLLPATGMSEEAAVGPMPALAPGKRRPCRKQGRWLTRVHQIRSASPRS
jgi:hypothetical protein